MATLAERASAPVETRMVVLEDALHAFEHLHAEGAGERPTCVVARDLAERPAQLALRALRRLATLETGNARVTRAVLAVDGSADRQSVAARELIARALLSHMIRNREGELLLAASDGDDDDARHELMRLAGLLVSESGPSTVSVVVRFGNGESPAEPKSGVFNKAPSRPLRATRRA